MCSRRLLAVFAGIFIKSGEGNGGDTWWDSGVIRKVGVCNCVIQTHLRVILISGIASRDAVRLCWSSRI